MPPITPAPAPAVAMASPLAAPMAGAPVSPAPSAPAANAAPSPAAAPAEAPALSALVGELLPATAASGLNFRFGFSHVVGAGGIGFLAGEIQPIVHWAVTGGTPDASCERSIATFAALALAGAAFLVQKITRGRAGSAANS